MTQHTNQLPLLNIGEERHAPTTQGEQLSLLGNPTPIRLPADLWSSWLTDETVVARFKAKCYVRSARQCWPWLSVVP